MSHQIQSFCNAVTLPPACPPWPAGSFPLPFGRLAGDFSRVFPPPRFLGHLCRTSLSSLHPGVHTGRLQDRQNAIAACGSDPPGSGGVNGAPLDFQGLLAGVISGRSLILNDHPFSLPLPALRRRQGPFLWSGTYHTARILDSSNALATSAARYRFRPLTSTGSIPSDRIQFMAQV